MKARPKPAVCQISFLLLTLTEQCEGDPINFMLASTALNIHKWMRDLASFWLRFGVRQFCAALEWCFHVVAKCHVSLAFATLVLLTTPLQALTTNEWRYRQTVDVPIVGLIRVELPPATLNVARAGLEDLRVLDPAGNEVPYHIDRPAPQAGSVRAPKTFRTAVDAENQTTTIIMEIGVDAGPVVGVSLETPATSFLKPARVEGSRDGENWQELITGQPIFKQSSGAENRLITLDKTAHRFFRITLDDRRAPPVPITGAQLHTLGLEAPLKEAREVAIKSCDESPGVTRLALDLGAANLPIALLRIETSAPLFTRNVTFAVPEVKDEEIRERMLGQAVIYRVDIDGKNNARLEIPIEQQIRSRELILLIRNDDSPPLAISCAWSQQRLTRLCFFAREPGQYSLFSGNAQCAAPRYDLAALASQLQTKTILTRQPSRLEENPNYQTPDTLLIPDGAPIDVAGWQFRKPVQLAASGVQQLELDLETIAHAAGDFRDLRLVRAEQQIPFLLERPSIFRTIAADASVIDPPHKSISRWELKLPQAGLPITQVDAVSTSPLFQRNMRLFEEQINVRGHKYKRDLGRATWQQTPGTPARQLAITLTQTPQTDTLFLETDNGDNPTIALSNVRFHYPVTRVIFKTVQDANSLWLYYGNSNAYTPRYDLTLISAQLLCAERTTARVGNEEFTKPTRPVRGETTAAPAGILFWCVLAGVVVVLLVIISRLLPNRQNE